MKEEEEIRAKSGGQRGGARMLGSECGRWEGEREEETKRKAAETATERPETAFTRM